MKTVLYYLAALIFLMKSFECLPVKDNNDNDNNNNDSDKDDVDQDQWQSWQSLHGRTYLNEKEMQKRFNTFQENLRFIESHNRQQTNASSRSILMPSYQVKLNCLADMSRDERRVRLGYKASSSKIRGRMSSSAVSSSANDTSLSDSRSLLAATKPALPASVDWRKSGAVTSVKDQGNCGCCWSFSATGALEGAYRIKNGVLRDFSEKNLMDCSWSYGNAGCSGGWMDGAFQYVRDKGGINLESAYPFRPVSSHTCRFNKSAVYAKVASIVDIPSGDENALKAAVAKGPVSVAIDASSDAFMFYDSGIYWDNDCSQSDLNHAVLIVGYGTENGIDYWIVKNSWSTDYGEAGYIRMARGRNTCGIATAASYPILA